MYRVMRVKDKDDQYVVVDNKYVHEISDIETWNLYRDIKMKISAFCLVTNATKFGYPFIESIKSWAKAVDEVVIVDGGSTDDTVKLIEEIGDSKIRIIQDEDCKWEDEWFYSRMGKNFNRGYHECTGDIVIKFDVDYVLHDSAYSDNPQINLRANCQRAVDQGKLTVAFIRWNLMTVDKHFYKRQKTLGVNRIACKQRSVMPEYGLDIKRWSWGYEPIVVEREENGIKFGTLIGTIGNFFGSNIRVFNYGFAFSTKEQVEWVRTRHRLAEIRQKRMKYKHIEQPIVETEEQIKKNVGGSLKQHIKNCLAYSKRPQMMVNLEAHPRIMHDKIRNLKPEQQGYDFWGCMDKSKYYD